MREEEQQPRQEASEKPIQKANGKDVLIKDPLGYVVTLAVDIWEQHIVARHPEMRDLLDLVTNTISTPQIIQRDTECSTCYYYRLTGRSFYRHNDIYINVVVERDDETKTGTVTTAYLVKKIRNTGEAIWLQRN
jgi:hypothetical protein